MKPPLQTLTTLSSLVAIGVLVLVTAMGVRSTDRLAFELHRVSHTQEVIAAANAALVALVDAETGQRGYVITGDHRFLEPYVRSLNVRGDRIRALQRLTADNPSQQTRLARLEGLAARHRVFLEGNVELRRTGQTSAAVRSIAGGRGKTLVDSMRVILRDVVGEEQRLLTIRSDRAQTAAVQARVVTVAIGALAAVLLAAAGLQIRKELLDRLRRERELAETNRALGEANQRLNQFVGMAAHDLRNPLTVVLGLGRVLLHKEGALTVENSRRLVEKIAASSEFMLRLVENLLSVSRIEAGHLQLELRPTDVNALVTRNVELNREVAAEKNIGIELSIPPGLPPVELDAVHIEQVLNNLLSNAIKFSQPGSMVTVSVERREGDLRLSVRDRGMGIPEAELDRLFRPFSRTSTRPTAGESSTGLGLAIAKQVVDAHHGSISVQSAVGVGTTFTVSVPVVPGSGRPALPKDAAATA